MPSNCNVMSDELNYLCREACSIPDSDSVLITGGLHSLSSVSRYDLTGWVEDLPNLGQERRRHGCGSYTRGDGTKVGIALSLCLHVCFF